MAKVFLHTRSISNHDWENSPREFSRVPVVGEHLATDFQSPWFEVELVIHCPFPGSDCEAEVYAVRVDPADVMKKRCPKDEKYELDNKWLETH
jgi:hypothetical protein